MTPRSRSRGLDKYVVRRAVAAAALLLVVVGVVWAVRGLTGGDDGPSAGSAPASTTATVGQVPAGAPTDTAARLARATVPVLCYHQIREPTGNDSAAYVTSPEQLDAHLTAIADAGYTTVTAGQYADHVLRGTVLPPKPIVLTFDDASEGHYSEALPILQRHGMTATFFVMTVVLGNEGWMTRDQVAETSAAGIEIGSHSWDHQAVTKLTTAADFRTQFRQPRTTLEEITGKPVTTFAYPFGITTPRVIGPLQKAGYTSAFQLAEPANARAPMFSIRRVAVGTIAPDALMRLIRDDFPNAPGEGGSGASTTTAPAGTTAS